MRSRTCWMISSGIRLTGNPGSASHPSHLLDGALPSGSGLLLLADAGLVVVLAPLQLGEDPRLLALFLEAPHRDFEGLVLPDLDDGHRDSVSRGLEGRQSVPRE